MTRFSSLFLLLLEGFVLSESYQMMTPISKHIMETKRTEGVKYKSKQNDLRTHLHEIVQDAFEDVLHLDNDFFSQGVAETDQKILLLGDRIPGPQVSSFCGALATKQLSHIPEVQRDGVLFKPTKQIPIPVTNLSVLLPSRWFRDIEHEAPLVFVCYEGDSFLKLHAIESSPDDWGRWEQFHKKFIANPYNERCRIREILVVLDDSWNNRYLLPRNLDARVIIETRSILPRVTFSEECDPELGVDQSCCLWKFHFDADGERREFHRCFGSIPVDALKSQQLPEALATLLVRGKMTRRFISPPNKACRETEFKPMVVKKPDGHLITMNRLDATKCAAFY